MTRQVKHIPVSIPRLAGIDKTLAPRVSGDTIIIPQENRVGGGPKWTILVDGERLVAVAYSTISSLSVSVKIDDNWHWRSIHDLDDEDKFEIASAARAAGVKVDKMVYENERYAALEALESF